MNQKQSLTTSLIVLISGTFLLTQFVFPELETQFALIHGGNYVNGYFPGVYTGQWWRLLTVALTHAGWLHLVFNMLALYSIGTPVEEFVGKFRFGIIFSRLIISGFCHFTLFRSRKYLCSWCIRCGLWIIWRPLCNRQKSWSQLPEHSWCNHR